AAADSADSSRPSKVTVPLVGSISRTRQRPRLVLPQPDSPTNPTVSPSPTSRLTPSTAFTCSCVYPSKPAGTGKYFFRSRISSSAILRSDEARNAVVPLDLDQRRWLRRATCIGAHATVAEPAARRPIERARDHAGNRREALFAAAPARQRVQQPDRVGMLWAGENDLRLCAFDDLAGVHDCHLVGAFRYDAEIVGDEQHGHAEPPLELADQLEDLRLDRHVECRGWLIRDQELGRAGERHGNHDALTLAAGELVRIIPDAFLGIGDLDEAQHLDRAIARLASACPLSEAYGFRHGVGDGDDRVQRGHRLLEDHRDLVAADAAHLLLRKARQISGLKSNFAADDAAGTLGQKLHNRERGHALAAAGLADQTD